MQENIKLLIELQTIDSIILKERNIIDLMPAKLLSADKSLKESQSLSDKQKQKYDLLEKKKKDKERLIEDIDERVKKLKSRTADIKTNKEYQAHLKEIESAEKERYAIEDETLSIMEELDTINKGLKTEEAALKAEKDKIEIFKKEVEEEIAEAEKKLGEFKIKRTTVVGSMDPETYDDYMVILEACNGLAVVEARDEICQGCYMNIPPQMFVEIKKNEDIIQCQQCRRILYWKEQNDVKD
ncbi:MAG: hypothetical protein HY754_07635 [Nitrospirae bacterium]|nr:hypothetical protein [Nitrospirota bacterium]